MEYKLQDRISAEFPNSKVEVVDLKGDGAHFQISVESKLFEGKSLLQQHQMVYKAMGDAMKSDVHAAKIITKIP